MSRSYSIRIPIEVLIPKEAGLAEGSFSIVFTMLEILPAQRMKDLLRQKLIEKGFVETPEGMAMPLADGNSAVLDLDTMTMKVSVPLPDKCVISVEEEYLKQFNERVKNAIEKGQVLNDWNVTGQIDRMKEEAIIKLKNLAISGRKEVNQALKEVYREAIKEKAATMGNVENVSESKEGNTYRIRIEIST